MDEALDFLEKIKDAEVRHYLMMAYVIQNPHSKDPRKMIDSLQKELSRSTEIDYKTDPNAKPEENAIKKLKSLLNKKA